MAHDYIRLSIICLSTDPTICLTANTASLLHSAGLSFLAIVYTKHSLASGPSLCLECSSLDIHMAGSLAFFRLHRCLSLTTVCKREVSSFPTILSFTLLLSFSSFLSLTYIFFSLLPDPCKKISFLRQGLCLDY